CPNYNYFLIGKTAQVDKLKSKTHVVFGTDSTVSAHWNLWEHLRLAKHQNMVRDSELFDMITSIPAKIWPIKGKGMLEKNYDADLVVARKKQGLKHYNAFFNLNPEDMLLVMHEGKIKLFDEGIGGQLGDMQGFT